MWKCVVIVVTTFPKDYRVKCRECEIGIGVSDNNMTGISHGNIPKYIGGCALLLGKNVLQQWMGYMHKCSLAITV